MKKLAIVISAMMLTATSIMARPGYTKPVDVFQPDGTTVTLLMHGDEFRSFMTTIDGYTVVKGSDGFYRFAQKNAEGMLEETSVVAKNPSERTDSENVFLANQKKMQAPKATKAELELKESAKGLLENPLFGRAAQKSVVGKKNVIWQPIDYSKFKGLVILVEWNDKKFLSSDPKSFYQDLTSKKNYTDSTKTNYPVNVEGSVRDYFYQNSMGIFDPTFDVVGPVTINYSCEYPWPKQNNQENPGFMNRQLNIIKAVMNAVNTTVDFTKYDLDNNGYIDMVYFIFAGYGSYVQGNNEKLLWPHANDLSSVASGYSLRWDNRYMGRYACSVEIQDYEGFAAQHQNFDGIGTMCHEFSHVLGLADHYDTDYEESGGESRHPDEWDVMAGGADHNYGLTPAGYSSYERYSLGFTELQTLDVAGNYELEPFDTSNKFYQLKTGTNNEVFYLENRQNQGWDRFLPSHGMLIWRVDETNPTVWQTNVVNTTPSRLYLELLSSKPDGDINSEYTPFPGEANVIDVLSDGTPALKSHAGKPAVLDLFDITETEDGKITFTAGKNLYDKEIETFETIAETTGDATDLNGTFCKWNLTNAVIATPASGKGNGNRVLKINRNGIAETQATSYAIRNFSFKVWNGTVKTKLSVKYRVSDQDNWTAIPTTDGKTQVDIAKNVSVELTYSQKIPAGAQIQISMLSTNNSAATYIDDIVFGVDKNAANGIDDIKMSSAKEKGVYNLAGQKVDANYKGIIVRDGKKAIVK